MSEIDDRRQRAIEAAWDEDMEPRGNPETAAIVATQVKITDDIIEAARVADRGNSTLEQALIAAFRAAGFEVVE